MDDIILEIFVFDNYIERSAEEIVAKFSDQTSTTFGTHVVC